MANKLYEETSIQAIADAIRFKNGTNATYTVSQMAPAIRALQTNNEADYNIYTTTIGITPQINDVLMLVQSEELTTTTNIFETTHPNGYLNDHTWIENQYTQNLDDFYTSTTSSSYAQLSMKTGTGAETYSYWTFDLEDIIHPEYTLLSVACSVKLACTAASNERTEFYIQLCNGTTPISSEIAIGGTSVVTQNIPAVTLTDWNILRNLTLKVSATRGTGSTNYLRYIRLYGANLEVTYTAHPEYITTLSTAKWSGTEWIPTSISNALDHTKTYSFN